LDRRAGCEHAGPIELIKATIEGMSPSGFGRIINISSSTVKAPIQIPFVSQVQR
jgi:NAD(P)-dependent dehydrogenase (short-subunit alcohol dehydrogenase family)